MNNKIKVLIIAYHFFPDKNVGAIRVRKFAKFLPENNFELFIITSECDEEFLERKIFIKKSRISNKTSFYGNYRDNISIINQVVTKLKIFIKDIFFSPDKYIWWSIGRFPQIIRLVKKEKIDIAFASGSPFSTFISLYFLKLFTSTPIIIDFRDPWKDSITQKKQSFLRKAITSFWEKKCIQSADGIIAVNDLIAKSFYKYNPSGKIMTITNGFDQDDFKNIKPESKKNSFIFLYTGKYSIYREDYNPETVFEAFKKFKIENPNNSKLWFIGPTDKDTLTFAESYKEYDIQCANSKSRNQIVYIQQTANVLIQFQYPENYKEAIPLKIYEYIFQKKPILSFNIKEGLLFDFIEEYKLGETASSHNINEMSNLFYKAEQGLLKFDPTTDISTFDKYNYKQLTQKLVRLIFDILKKSS